MAAIVVVGAVEGEVALRCRAPSCPPWRRRGRACARPATRRRRGSAAAVRMMAPTLNGPCTSSSTSATRPSVRRRHSRCSRFMPVPSSCFTPGAPRARGSPPASCVGPTDQPSASSQRCSESAPRCFCTTRTARPVGASRPSQVPSSVVQGRLADADGRVRPQLVDDQVRRHLVAGDDAHVGEPEALGVRPAQLEGPLVHVDRPHGRGGRAPGQRARDRSVAAAEVDQGARRRPAPDRRAGGASSRCRSGRGRTPRGRWRG